MADREFPITLIMVSYNKADTIDLAIESAARGSVVPDLIVVSDDGSSDGTPEVAKATAKKCGIPLRLIQHQRVGTYRLQTMRNTCAANALDDGIVFLSDSDCLFGEYSVEAHYEIHRQNPLAVGTGPRFEFLEGSAGPFTTTLTSLEYSHYPEGNYLIPVGANMSFRKLLWQRLPFDRAYEGAYGLDEFEFASRAVRAGAVCVSDPAAFVFHIPHETTFGHRKPWRNIWLFDHDNGGNHVQRENQFTENHVIPWYWAGNRKRSLLGDRPQFDGFWGAPQGFVPPATMQLLVSVSPMIRRALEVVRHRTRESLFGLRYYCEGIEEPRLAHKSVARTLFESLNHYARRTDDVTAVVSDLEHWLVGARRLEEEMESRPRHCVYS
jgi:GT2 family glycosyltransferase